MRDPCGDVTATQCAAVAIIAGPTQKAEHTLRAGLLKRTPMREAVVARRSGKATRSSLPKTATG